MNSRHLLVRIGNALKTVWRHDICRLQPLGMFNWCYFRPNLSNPQAMHRQLWWWTRYKLPVLLWLPLELWRWIYWQIWAAPRQVHRVVSKLAATTEANHGVSLSEQRRMIEYWAKSWTIQPEQAYAKGLFRPKVDGLACILGDEMQPFHRLMNEKRGVSPTDYRWLFDKTQLSDLMTAAGMPVVPVIAESDGGMEDLRKALASHGAVFCKLRAGSRGESAFMAESTRVGLIGQTLAGKKLDSEAAVLKAWKTLADKGHVLIQPYLRNHPLLQGFSAAVDSITLRVITRMQGDDPEVWAGLLYVQAPGDSLEREYWLLKIDADSGRVFDAFGHWLDLESSINVPEQLLLLDGQAIPFWQDIVRHSQRAHAELPRLWAIAWDWIVTPDGPVLLEGNAGWDLSPLQELGFDFVQLALEEGL